jgi:hypothetical protein
MRGHRDPARCRPRKLADDRCGALDELGSDGEGPRREPAGGRIEHRVVGRVAADPEDIPIIPGNVEHRHHALAERGVVLVGGQRPILGGKAEERPLDADLGSATRDRDVRGVAFNRGHLMDRVGARPGNDGF